MLKIHKILFPQNIAQAYQWLQDDPSNLLLGGATFHHLGERQGNCAIDLTGLDLNYLKEDAEHLYMGAMVDLYSLEKQLANQEGALAILAQAVSALGGVQLRNLITMGGLVASKYGASDVITGLLALDAQILLYKQGLVPLEDYLLSKERRDIILEIIVKKSLGKAAISFFRNSNTDHSILNAAVYQLENSWRLAVGGRPKVAQLCVKTMEQLAQGSLSPAKAGLSAAEEMSFASDLQASGEYRQKLCSVLVRRVLEEVYS